ncbi:MAG: ATP-binding region [candidate division BRC1 bacterium ADurb.BinA292]|nr:MAG: ATP-binding region [candidate division BRC1 bacterium ADurb.BinA292]
MHHAAMLWTGGKDCALALDEAIRTGIDIRCLATFAPPRPDFLAHPLALMQLQARAMDLPHHIVAVTAPFDQGYETGLARLRDEFGIDGVVTGDISEVDGCPNWIRERCRPVGLDVLTPLWGRDRADLLRLLLERGFKVRISCVKTRCLAPNWIGREIDESTITDFTALHDANGFDLCGENGEYHTIVTGGPRFRQPIAIHRFTTRTGDGLAWIEIAEMALAL